MGAVSREASREEVSCSLRCTGEAECGIEWGLGSRQEHQGSLQAESPLERPS